MTTLSQIDIAILFAYIAITLGVGFWVARGNKNTTVSYFLAGRNMGWFAIGASLFATNISSEHFVGLAGSGAERGLAVGNFELFAIPFLILLGWVFAPLFIKANIFTVPEFFGKRFNSTTRLFLSGLSILTYLITKISISLFACGLLMKGLLGWDMYTSGIILMIITGLYTIVGGLRAVVYSSVIQSFFLIFGGLLLTGIALSEANGINGLHSTLSENYFSLFKPMSDPDFPWTGMLFGAPILAIWYWCTDQYIVQRILSAKDISNARSGTILTGFLKILPMFILVMPGLAAAVLFPGIKGDEALPTLITSSLLPVGIKGLVLAGVIAALMSSLSACFISTSTLFTMDFYRHFRPESPDEKLVLVGRLTTTVIVFLGILWVPLMKLISQQIYVHLQSIQAYISPPVAAVFLLGIFWKRANGKSAVWALIIGEAIGFTRLGMQIYNYNFFDGIPFLEHFLTVNYLHFAIFLFFVSTFTMVVISLLSEAPYPEIINRYIINVRNFITPYRGNLASTNSEHISIANHLSAGTLILVLIVLWGVFF